MKMEAKKVILSRQLPKTGQTMNIQDEDDGYYQAGWWKGRTSVDNKTRFVTKTISGNDVVIDRATGLMWAADGNAGGCFFGGTEEWITAIGYATALNFAGFTDWRLPNIFELFSIANHSGSKPTIAAAFFPNTFANFYWSSTRKADGQFMPMAVHFNKTEVRELASTENWYIRCVRGGL